MKFWNVAAVMQRIVVIVENDVSAGVLVIFVGVVDDVAVFYIFLMS